MAEMVGLRKESNQMDLQIQAAAAKSKRVYLTRF